ncbi:hypothetical protein [Amycolatopsis nalaikhensis]|uniref:Integral membrane protein n=1 Tax=Amycolatopsis nalaikhensis TaxID=715472 RepID=A0ABY8XS13_9PSEU|nr:hypothetical protein [Amycolatopsis sp. 2-2]WIV58455.1 hypothetical protein QP939_07410 [Amycolatopsis sp. 2-2]
MTDAIEPRPSLPAVLGGVVVLATTGAPQSISYLLRVGIDTPRHAGTQLAVGLCGAVAIAVCLFAARFWRWLLPAGAVGVFAAALAHLPVLREVTVRVPGEDAPVPDVVAHPVAACVLSAASGVLLVGLLAAARSGMVVGVVAVAAYYGVALVGPLLDAGAAVRLAVTGVAALLTGAALVGRGAPAGQTLPAWQIPPADHGSHASPAAKNPPGWPGSAAGPAWSPEESPHGPNSPTDQTSTTGHTWSPEQAPHGPNSPTDQTSTTGHTWSPEQAPHGPNSPTDQTSTRSGPVTAATHSATRRVWPAAVVVFLPLIPTAFVAVLGRQLLGTTTGGLVGVLLVVASLAAAGSRDRLFAVAASALVLAAPATVLVFAHSSLAAGRPGYLWVVALVGIFSGTAARHLPWAARAAVLAALPMAAVGLQLGGDSQTIQGLLSGALLIFALGAVAAVTSAAAPRGELPAFAALVTTAAVGFGFAAGLFTRRTSGPLDPSAPLVSAGYFLVAAALLAILGKRLSEEP